MDTTGLPELWHTVLAILSRQGPFVQIMMVTSAALFVVMALEGFRSSIRTIWHAHRTPGSAKPTLDAPVSLAAPGAFAPRTRSFKAKPRSARPKGADQLPRQFRSPRPTIKRVTSFALGEENRAPESEGGAVSLPAGSVP